jgi:hypothetical protein
MTVFTRERPIWSARALTDGDVIATPQIGADLPPPDGHTIDKAGATGGSKM